MKIPTDRTIETARKKSVKFNRTFLLIMLISVFAIFVFMIRPFLMPVLMAAVFTTLFYPLYSLVLRAFRNRRGLSALACCFILFVGLLIPVYVLGNLVTHEAISLFQTGEQNFR